VLKKPIYKNQIPNFKKLHNIVYSRVRFINFLIGGDFFCYYKVVSKQGVLTQLTQNLICSSGTLQYNKIICTNLQNNKDAVMF